MLDKCVLVPSEHTSLFCGHVNVKHMYFHCKPLSKMPNGIASNCGVGITTNLISHVSC